MNKVELDKHQLLEMYDNMKLARNMLKEARAPQSMVARLTEALLAVSWLVDNRD